MLTGGRQESDVHLLDDLRADGPRRDAGIAQLHELLLRAARY
jgi:hypothetical protein